MVAAEPKLTDPAAGAVAYIALGANLDDPERQIDIALTELAALPDSALFARSGLYRSKAVGYLDQPDFINAVAGLRTRLSPRALLAALFAIESRHGRDRAFKNAPRTLDLDLLLYDDLVLREPGLSLPHPRMTERAFVLAPLAEIAPDARIPGGGAVGTLLRRLDVDDLSRLPTGLPPAANSTPLQ